MAPIVVSLGWMRGVGGAPAGPTEGAWGRRRGWKGRARSKARRGPGARGGLTPGPRGDGDLRVGGSRGGRRARDPVERRHAHGVARPGPQVQQRGGALAEPGLARHEGHARPARLARARRALAAAAQAQQRVRDVRAAARVGWRQPVQPKRQRRAAQAVLQVPRRGRRPWGGTGGRRRQRVRGARQRHAARGRHGAWGQRPRGAEEGVGAGEAGRDVGGGPVRRWDAGVGLGRSGGQ